MRLASLLFLLSCFGTAHAGWFGPKNYDECILENMKGVTIVQAVWAIKSSCRAKFPQACREWKKSRDSWKIERDNYYKNAAPCVLDKTKKKNQSKCAANDHDCMKDNLDSDPEFQKKMCEIMSGFHEPKEPPAPEGCPEPK